MRARLALVLIAGVASALALTAPASAATRECDGLQVCVPVAGPWVVVPTGRATGQVVEFQLDCPRGYIVGGLDAELSSPAIDVTFAATLGSPVNPGISTSASVVFSGRYVGLATQAPATMRPRIGCIPARGGGGRVPTAASALFPPGKPTTRRVRNAPVRSTSMSLAQGCARGERLIGAAHALAFVTPQPPTAAVVRAVRAQQAVRGGRVVVSVKTSGRAAFAAQPLVQLSALCTESK